MINYTGEIFFSTIGNSILSQEPRCAISDLLFSIKIEIYLIKETEHFSFHLFSYEQIDW